MWYKTKINSKCDTTVTALSAIIGRFPCWLLLCNKVMIAPHYFKKYVCTKYNNLCLMTIMTISGLQHYPYHVPMVIFPIVFIHTGSERTNHDITRKDHKTGGPNMYITSENKYLNSLKIPNSCSSYACYGVYDCEYFGENWPSNWPVFFSS